MTETPKNWKKVKDTPKTTMWKRKSDVASVAMVNSWFRGWEVEINDPHDGNYITKIECGKKRTSKELAERCAYKYMRKHPEPKK